MKKILLYTDTPQVGGAELQMFLLAKFLNKTNFTPVLIASAYPELEKWFENFEKEAVKVIRMPVKSKHDPKHYSLLKEIIKEEKPDILHIHVWNPASGRYSFLAANSAKIPIITTEHDPFKLNFLKNFFKKRTLKSVRKIITVSENNRKILAKLYPKHAGKISVIHNGIDLVWWQSQLLRFTDEDRHEVKEHLFKAEKEDLIITTIAELHERKGHKYLIEAAAELVQKHPNLKFVFIGDGPERQKLEKQIAGLKLENQIILLGKQKEIPKLLKTSDIFVLPSRREAFGLVLAEAMITPLPVIAAKVGGIPEIVKDGQTGILVKAQDSHALAIALEKLIKDEHKRQSLAASGFKRVETYFNAKLMAQKYENEYEKLI